MKIVDHGAWPLRPEDEGTHPPGVEPLWSESLYLDFATADGSLAGYVRLGLYPNWNRAWYWACLVGPGRPTVLLADHHVPLPGPDLAVRGAGFSATHDVTAPLRSFRLTLDAAAALVLDDPALAYAYPDGTVTGGPATGGTVTGGPATGGALTGGVLTGGPATGGVLTGGAPEGAAATSLAFDLEWTTVGGVYPYGFIPRYEIPCEVAGTIRTGGEEIAFSGHGERDHSWGERDWWGPSWLWSSGRLDDGTFFHGMRANLGFEMSWPCFTVPPGGEIEHREGFVSASGFGPDGLPSGARLEVPGTPMTAVPLAFAPVAMTSPDGETARFPRALCRYETADGRQGYGWSEWHQPPGWRGHGWR